MCFIQGMFAVNWSTLWQSPKVDRMGLLGGNAAFLYFPSSKHSPWLVELAGRGKLIVP